MNNIRNCTLVVVMATALGSGDVIQFIFLIFHFFYYVFTPAASSSAKVYTPHRKMAKALTPKPGLADPYIPKQFNLPHSACPLHVTLRNAFSGSCKHSLCCVSVFISSGEESHRNSAWDTDKHTQVNVPDLPQPSVESYWIYDCLSNLRWTLTYSWKLTGCII